MLYNIVLFLHITGALLLCAAMAIEWLCILEFRKADSMEMIRRSVLNYSKLNKIGPVGMLLVLIPGIYMMVTVWKAAGWIIVSLAGLVLLGAIGGILTGRKMYLIKQQLEQQEETSDELKELLLYNSFWISIKIRITIFLGIIFLMTIKPGLTASIVTLAVSILIGFIPVQMKKYSMNKEKEI